MTDVEKAKRLFQKAGLAFPKIPEELSVRLKERAEWHFSTRKTEEWPYMLDDYVNDVEKSSDEDYVVLSHSGHGVNSYAIQYYLVYCPLRMFLFLGWGGVYMDAQEEATKIRDCFSLADKIIPAVQSTQRLGAGDQLTIVASDFYGSYWLAPGESHRDRPADFRGPAVVLAEVLDWLTTATCERLASRS
jgi:hypothetical protein